MGDGAAALGPTIVVYFLANLQRHRIFSSLLGKFFTALPHCFVVFLFVLFSPLASAQFSDFDFYDGVVRLPEGFVATGEEQITITAQSLEFFPTSFEFFVVIQVGQNEGAFSFLLNRDDTPAFWLLSLRCENCDEGISVDTHFPTTEFGDPISLNASEQFNFQVDQGERFRNLQLTFISTGPPSTEEEPDAEPNAAPVIVPTIDLLLNSD